MAKQTWKPGTVLYPVPVVMVSCGSEEKGNITTVAWTGTINSDPAMTYISLRKSRYSHEIISKTGEFVINLVPKSLTAACDTCGVKCGRDINKFEAMGLTPVKGQKVSAPIIDQCPVNIECKVTQVLPLGSHDMFLAEVVGVSVDDTYLDETGKFHLEDAEPICYSHGTYYALGEELGTFGYSVRKKPR